MILSQEIANDVWNILIRECGASNSEDARSDFVWRMSHQDINEYRFQGFLGFGGKFWSGRFKVTYYPEDETPEREAMVEKANAKLKELHDRHRGLHSMGM